MYPHIRGTSKVNECIQTANICSDDSMGVYGGESRTELKGCDVKETSRVF